MTEENLEHTAAPLMEHLTELRNRLIWSVVTFVIAVLAVFTVWNPIFNFLTKPICGELARIGQSCQFSLIKLQEGFFTAISISMFGGFMLSFPVIAWHLWRFVAPGLYRNEKKAFLPFLLASPIMFFLGAAFAFYFVLPTAFAFFLTFQQGVETEPGKAADATRALGTAGIMFQGSVQEYLGLTMKFVLAFGVTFQLPVLLTLMGKAGLVTSAQLAGGRKYAFVIILILAAVVTPPDVMSQVILFAAVYPLYEISILLIRRFEKLEEARLKAEGLWVEPVEDE